MIPLNNEDADEMETIIYNLMFSVANGGKTPAQLAAILKRTYCRKAVYSV